MSDGELGEGSNWEAILFASHHKLNNLIAIIDRNKLQSLKSTEETLKLEPLTNKFESFGAKVFRCDGHNIDKIQNILNLKVSKKPKVIIADTIKGKGISFMENNNIWHYKNPNAKQLKIALQEIDKKYA